MNRTANLHRTALALIFLLLSAGQLRSQSGEVSDRSLIENSRNVEPPFAGKYEARVGSSYESVARKLRLDIGASVDLFGHATGSPAETIRDRDLSDTLVSHWSVGTDFFTWTRLRSTGDFKFPVEAVDYYFGLNGAWHQNRGLLSDLRLRVAHISAHLVDGDPSFTDPAAQYMTYSREFADLMVGFNPGLADGVSHPACRIRPYVGGLWLFHTIPDTLGRITPYAGFDGYWEPSRTLPVSVKFGYEARLNTELEPIGEHLFRLGVKLAPFAERVNGVLIEGSYYAGRSPYGQHFWKREKFWSLGFAAEF